jgi:hypothetical protein
MVVLATAPPLPHVMKMKRRSNKTIPTMMGQLTIASLETVYHRSMMMAQGTCSLAEYQRMVMESNCSTPQ